MVKIFKILLVNFKKCLKLISLLLLSCRSTALKNDSSKGVFLCINQNFKNAFFTEHLRIGNFQGKHLYRSPVPLTLKGMACDFINVGLCQEYFQKNVGTLLFRDRYSRKAMRLFVFKIKVLYFFGQLLCSTVFEHDKHMITMLNNQTEDICFECIHTDKKKTKI